MMTFNTLEPFIPSGADFEASKKLFQALGFTIRWEAADYIGFEKDNCKFILQNYNDKHFAENLMVRVGVSDLDEFWQEVNEKELTKQFDIKMSPPTQFPHGREVNMIDIAGVCWHFGEGA